MITRFALPMILAVAVVACSNEGTKPGASAPPASSPSASATEAQAKTISAAALHQRLQAAAPKPLVIDVREPSEFAEGHIAEAQLVPLGTVEAGLASVPKDQEIVLVCRSGRRSGEAQNRLAQRGYTNLTNVEGGMIAWKDEQLPVVK
jgi:rhodanese-related sulfurtransferase